MRKQYIEVPLSISCGFFYRWWRLLKGLLLSPIYLVIAYIMGAPGIGFHLRCAAAGISLLVTGRAPLKTCYGLFFSPMDSTRYFEFHEVWQCLKGHVFSQGLDVSSPRLMPLFLLQSRHVSSYEMLNPDHNDLKVTENLAGALRLKSRCKFFNGILDTAEYIPASFDLITCISVLEHIPEDKHTIAMLWDLLAPGGKLILTLPCMAQPCEQYISDDPYGVLEQGEDGYTFFQRYYDRKRLETEIYSITGGPIYTAVYGEKMRGSFFRNAGMKRLLGCSYPFWRESYMMAREYKYFSSIDELPGEGVVVLQFLKKGDFDE